jgi:hypothetical protein
MTTTQTKTDTISKAKSNTKPKRSKIILIDGEIGGIGKSMVARVLVEQTLAAGQSFYLIDADASTPNVGMTYEKEMYERFRADADASTPNVSVTYEKEIYERFQADADNELQNSVALSSAPQRQITFTGSAKSYFEADQILVLAETKDVIVVLPSQVATYVNLWIKQNDIVGMVEDPNNTIDVYKFFVTNGTPESLALFAKSVETCKGKITHVLIKNHGATTNINWSWFDRDKKATTILEQYGFKVVDFPELLVIADVKTKTISENIPFGDALKAEWMPSPSKRRITSWLKEATISLASTGLVPYHPSYTPEKN